MQGNATVISIETLVAALSYRHAERLNLQQQRIRREVGAQARAAFLVWRAATSGALVVSGTVELPEHGVLLLEGHGVTFHDVSFEGAALSPPPPCLPLPHAHPV